MARTSKKLVKHVISFRVNELEREALEEIADEFGVTISTLLRKSLKLLEKAYLNGDGLDARTERRNHLDL